MTLRIEAKPIRLLSSWERSQLGKLTVSADSHMAAVLEDNPATARCWLALEGQSIMGWSLLRWFKPEIPAAFNAYISVYVKPDSRNGGIGKRLVREASAYAENHEMNPLVYGISASQVKFYEKCGFPLSATTSLAFPRRYWDHCRFVKRYYR